MPINMKMPGPDHPITIGPASGRVTVRAGGAVIASSDRALALREANYPPVLYIPREDVAMDRLRRTDQYTHCPYKGDCAYFSVASAGPQGENAAWSYESPYPAVAAIRGHLAFYPDRVDAIETS
ncbi:DUF427 domain-containing protein [Massilia luteola]|uniref:DUF427 domain-containing protein n=1 Tax=Massilia luteola TaxID=3081751 RepID=UPI002ACBE6E5|nr:DUF427 domain-containing protein [Massilia sp. Gc5]